MRKINRLTERDRQEARKFFSVYDGSIKSKIARIGRPSSILSGTPDVRRHMFGMNLMVLASFILVLFIVIPNDSRRWLIFGFAWLTLLVGAWQVDLSRK